MKIGDLIGKMNMSSNCKIRLKTDINDPGVLTSIRSGFGHDCTIRSFEIINNELTIYYKPIKINLE